MGSPSIGDCAPDFQLLDTDFNKVSLRDFLKENKPVVLAFFPAAFSPVCTNEMCAIRDRISELERADAVVVGISVDSPFVLKEFKSKHNLGFRLLSDFNKEAIKSYGVIHEDLLGLKMVAKRSVFVINPGGRITYKWVSDDPRVEPDYEEVIREADRSRDLQKEPC